MKMKMAILILMIIIAIMIMAVVVMIMMKRRPEQKENFIQKNIVPLDFSDANMPKFVITLHTSDERNEHIKATFPYSFEFFYGVDGRDDSLNIMENPMFIDGMLSKAERGCFLSHVDMWREIDDRRLQYTAIFENDVISKMNTSTLKVPNDFDILFLGHCFEAKGQIVSGGLYSSVYPRCAHGYIVTLACVRKLLQFIDDRRHGIPIDDVLAECVREERVIAYSFWPQLVDVAGLDSTIGERGARAKIS
jgi:hypothetical protein